LVGETAEERYPGERRGLGLFLEELLPVVEGRGDGLSLLRHAIRRALETGELARLRHARQIFNFLPRAERQSLSSALLGARARPPAPAAPPGRPEEAATAATPAVCFELARESDARRPLTVGLREEPTAPAPVRVTVAPGTLPSVAADTLRRIAATIEADRRLLSARFWEQGGPAAPENGDQRDAR
jgi:hypothetical protein